MPSPVATTTAIAWKAALLANMQSDTNLAGWQITSVYPGSTLRAQAVYYGKTQADQTLPVMTSTARVKRQEEYTVELIIDVATGLADTTQAEAAALGVLGEIDNLLASNMTQGVTGPMNTTGVWKAYIRSWETRPFMDDQRQGWAVLCIAKIAVSARLQ